MIYQKHKYQKQMIKKYDKNNKFTIFFKSRNINPFQIRFYGPMVAPFIVSVLLLGLSHQTKLFAQRREGNLKDILQNFIKS